MTKKKTLYDELGIPKTASQADIKKAYRKKASTHHPDKGGSHEEFALITTAYNILKDPTKREMYDQTGSERITSFEEEVRNVFLQAIKVALAGNSSDLYAATRKHLQNGVDDLTRQVKESSKYLEKLESKQHRIRLKNPNSTEPNLFEVIINSDIELQTTHLENLKKGLKILEAARQKINEYESDELFGEIPNVSMTWKSKLTSATGGF